MSHFSAKQRSLKDACFAPAVCGVLVSVAVWCLLAGCAASSEPQPLLRNGERELPRITFANLSPPYLEHDYFEGSEKFPFEFDAESFSLINAWWLAEASTLAYAEEDFVESRFRQAGLPEVKFFRNLSTQCYVASNDQFAIVAFRGSEIWKKRAKFKFKEVTADLITDMDIWPTPWGPGGKVHRGFMAALDEVWPQLLPYMRRLDEKGCKIWITGHSLGAALATLCANRYGRAQGVYTFGSPRVGNEEFKSHLAVDIYRVVNDDDIVPRLPSLGVYVHVGELKFIDRKGVIRGTSSEKAWNDYPAEEETNGQGYPSPSGNNSSGGFVPAAFRDHVPLLYSVRLWNSMVRQQRKKGRLP